MKRAVYWVAAAVIFLLAMSFAMRNDGTMTLDYYMGLHWEGPKYLVLLGVFTLGIFTGYLASLRTVLNMQRQTVKARKEVRQMEQELNNLRSLPIKDVI